ncbi:MAG: hypothetical protein KGL71_12270, partial [Xanthomonadaceae bacterium]|nr:hypothetical protein [Xanthomonadaceae bacterium]
MSKLQSLLDIWQLACAVISALNLEDHLKQILALSLVLALVSGPAASHAQAAVNKTTSASAGKPAIKRAVVKTRKTVR